MKYYELELDGEIIKFRLTTSDCKQLEKKTGKSVIDYLQDISMTSISTIIMYMRRSEVPQFSEKDADDLVDKLVDNGYTLETMLYDIIFEGLVVSGFLKKADLMEMKDKATEIKEKKTQEILAK